MTDEMKKVAAEICHCVSCQDCDGQGHYYVDLRGQYIGANRCDDLSDSETCDGCGGSGLSETCDRCQLLEEMDQDHYFA